MMETRARMEALAREHLPAILRLIDDVVGASTPAGSGLAAMCRYQLQTGGKRLRAMAPLLVAEALGIAPARLVPFGAACEVLHNATLVHDDLQDGDETRRGEPTVWKRFGVPQAINLGDAMFYYALLMLRRLDVPLEVRERAATRLLTDTLKVIDGQEREFALRQSARPTLAEYQTMVEGKTSALFALPLAGAADVCGAPPALVDGLATAAGHLGVLFQVQDDLLDLWGEKGRGQRGSDIAEGKRSFLVVHAFTHAAPGEADWLRGVLDRPREHTTSAAVVAAAALLVRPGARDAGLRELRRRAALAAAVPAVADHAALHALVRGLATVFCAPVGHLDRQLETAA
ncbi:MAG: polyprenyl synthetase family protein [Deltaproteobacteria bacterium]|nr:polyprenyl synthetase family protein [Deltaproteobacteria bacterium]